MPIQSQDQLESDLDFIIEQNGVTLIGVTPSAVYDVSYKGLLFGFNEGHQETVSDSTGGAKEEELEASFLINANKYTNLPEKGAILRASTSTKRFKVFVTSKDDLNPTAYKLSLIAEYSDGL